MNKVVIKYQYTSKNGKLNGVRTMAVKGKGNIIDKATKAFLEQISLNRSDYPGDVYLLGIES